MKWVLLMVFVLLVAIGISSIAAVTTITIATVANPDMVIMQALSPYFEALHPNIKLNWVILPENELRQKVTTDIAVHGGAYNVVTIGDYEVPLWAKNGWLVPFTSLPATYDEGDLISSIKDSLSYKGTLYALPFYGESSMIYYRKDLFAKAGLVMPEHPTWNQIETFAKILNDPSHGVYGIVLRGEPGWGENMAPIDTVINAFGGEWFNMQWQPQLTSPAFEKAVNFYVNLDRKYGPPGVTSMGFTECETFFAGGHAAMWYDATVAAGYLSDPKTSSVASDVGFAFAPSDVKKNTGWLWSWALAIPSSIPASSEKSEAARTFILWATSKQYIKLVAEKYGWLLVPPGTRYSTYENPNYLKVASAFALITEESIDNADILHPTVNPVPYIGIQYVDIPEFEAIGTQVGQYIAAALAGTQSVETALQQSQDYVLNIMKEAGYIK
ncbi:MAG: sugar ABC transporter substrate-binding protein [Candidatus Parvarchaeota archaeon]|nr:sugar ABC transporter substrate-binding protein [Candidatus Jingweiarchaeum tengchongense]